MLSFILNKTIVINVHELVHELVHEFVGMAMFTTMLTIVYLVVKYKTRVRRMKEERLITGGRYLMSPGIDQALSIFILILLFLLLGLYRG